MASPPLVEPHLRSLQQAMGPPHRSHRLPGPQGLRSAWPGEVPWEIKVFGEGKDATAYKSSYLGDHYGTKDVLVLFEQSRDGLKWEPVPPCTKESAAVYRGGVCEVSFEFTKSGDLVAIGRNEDGDPTGFGTQLFTAKKGSLGSWTQLKVHGSYSHRVGFDSTRRVEHNCCHFNTPPTAVNVGHRFDGGGGGGGATFSCQPRLPAATPPHHTHPHFPRVFGRYEARSIVGHIGPM